MRDEVRSKKNIYIYISRAYTNGDMRLWICGSKYRSID